MNETEYHLYARLSGLLAAREVEKRDWNVQNPTQQDIRRLETIFSETRDAAREYVTAARQAKALDRMGDYRQAMRRLRAKIREAEERSR
jgi:hypothetical protein